MFRKIVLPLLGLGAFICAVASPSEEGTMSPQEAIQRAMPELQVEINPTTRFPAAMDASLFAFKFREGKFMYKEGDRVIVTRRRMHRTPGSYRTLPLPQDVKAAVIELGKAWEKAADAFPRNRTLYDLVSGQEAGADDALSRIEDAYAGLRTAAAGHGVTLPAAWGFIDQAKLALVEVRRLRKAGS